MEQTKVAACVISARYPIFVCDVIRSNFHLMCEIWNCRANDYCIFENALMIIKNRIMPNGDGEVEQGGVAPHQRILRLHQSLWLIVSELICNWVSHSRKIWIEKHRLLWHDCARVINVLKRDQIECNKSCHKSVTKFVTGFVTSTNTLKTAAEVELGIWISFSAEK